VSEKTQCPNCGQTVFNTHNGWKAHIEFCPITQLHQAVIEASVTGNTQGVLSVEIRRKVDRAIAAIQAQARAEVYAELDDADARASGNFV